MLFRIALVVLSLLVLNSQAATVEEFVASFSSPLEEVDRAIIKDFTRAQDFTAKDIKGLTQDFVKFKKQWTERMIEFLIRELDINEEGAREARKNPESFYINYETYKIFTNSF